MGIMDLFKAKENEQLKIKNKELNFEIESLKSKLLPEHNRIEELHGEIKLLEVEKENLIKDIQTLGSEKSKIEIETNEKKADLIILDEELLMQDFGLYKPTYDFANAEMYKDKLEAIRQLQKDYIKDKSAVNFSTSWTVDGSQSKGKKMTNDNIKQILRCFNNESENATDRVKFNNIESMRKRIIKAYDVLNKLNETNRVSITNGFLELKLQELNLAYEYQIKKQEEKEEQKSIRLELREQAKLQKELEEAKKDIDKELKHYSNALSALLEQLSNDKLDGGQRELLLAKKIELESQLETLNDKLTDVDYRQANQRAGYVYIISNIGAFGKNVYKIGMTRRLDPQDRIDELGDASVPFRFDIHAMIFTKDAPALENALHIAFENKKVNMINRRREFFNVTLDDIKKVVKNNFDKTIEFVEAPEAEQYRESMKIKELKIS